MTSVFDAYREPGFGRRLRAPVLDSVLVAWPAALIVRFVAGSATALVLVNILVSV